MKAWLIDAWRNQDMIVLWLKTEKGNLRIEKTFTATIYAAYSAVLEKYFREKKIKYKIEEKPDYNKNPLKVFSFGIQKLSRYEKIAKFLETKTKHRLRLYNADIPPEQMFLFEHHLIPCSLVEVLDEGIRELDAHSHPVFSTLEIRIAVQGNISNPIEARITAIAIGSSIITGEEETMLRTFAETFAAADPDVIFMPRAFSMLPFLELKLKQHGISCAFHRYDPEPLKHRGGKSFFSYGNIVYRDFAIRLHGRLLVDSTTFIGSECSAEAIVELCELSGWRFQHIASRSFGATFQAAIVRELYQRGCLIPFKEKPTDTPISLFNLLKGDRVGHTLDSKVGFHTNVAELDFASMYPWIIYNHNISTETLQSTSEPLEHVPGLPLTISHHKKGIVPIVIKPFLDKRMEYKRNPSPQNKRKSQGLKWVLVTSYGYLRFREFKLGMMSSHMAIGAFAREILLKAVHIAEEHGFTMVHGIIDSLYIKKKGMTEQEARDLCKEIEQSVGIPLFFEGIFKWMVFLPSIADAKRPVPTHYYGAMHDGTIKARGIEVRSKNVPLVVKAFQQHILEDMASCETKKQILERIPSYIRHLRKTIAELDTVESALLISSIVVSKTSYSYNIPQQIALEALAKKGYAILPGQKIQFIFDKKGIVVPEDYSGKPDAEHYQELLIRALFVLLEPFVKSKHEIIERVSGERQTTLAEFCAKQQKAYKRTEPAIAMVRACAEDGL